MYAIKSLDVNSHRKNHNRGKNLLAVIVDKNRLIKRIKYYMCLPNRKHIEDNESVDLEFEEISSIDIFSEQEYDYALSDNDKKMQLTATRKH